MANIWQLEKALRREKVFRDRNNPPERYNQELMEKFHFLEKLSFCSLNNLRQLIKNTK